MATTKRIGVSGFVVVATDYDREGSKIPAHVLQAGSDRIVETFAAGITELARGGIGSWIDRSGKQWVESTRVYLVSGDDYEQLYKYADFIRTAYSQASVVLHSGGQLTEITA